MDEQMIADIRQAIVRVMPSGACMVPSQIDRLATAAHSVMAGKVAELTEALEKIANHTGRRMVPDAQHRRLVDVTHRDLSEIARAALAPYPERRSERHE